MILTATGLAWSYEDFEPYIESVLQAFGIDRVMFGSDWPVCLLAAEYDRVLEIVQRYFARFAPSEKAKVFGQNAIDFYRIA